MLDRPLRPFRAGPTVGILPALASELDLPFATLKRQTMSPAGRDHLNEEFAHRFASCLGELQPDEAQVARFAVENPLIAAELLRFEDVVRLMPGLERAVDTAAMLRRART